MLGKPYIKMEQEQVTKGNIGRNDSTGWYTQYPSEHKLTQEIYWQMSTREIGGIPERHEDVE